MTDFAPGSDRLRMAFLFSFEDEAPSESCPPPEEIWEASLGQAAPDRARQVLAHSAECGACARAWRFALEVQAEAGLATRASGERRPAPRGLRWKAWGAAAAVAAALLLAIVGPRLFREAPPPSHRTGESEAIRSLLPPGQRLPRDRFVLRWSGAPAGSTFDVHVATPDLRVVDELRGLEASEYRVPPERFSGLPAGSKVLWRVEARRPDGSRLASPTFVIVVD